MIAIQEIFFSIKFTKKDIHVAIFANASCQSKKKSPEKQNWYKIIPFGFFVLGKKNYVGLIFRTAQIGRNQSTPSAVIILQQEIEKDTE